MTQPKAEQAAKPAPQAAKPKERVIVGYRLMTPHYLGGRMRPEGYIASPALLKGKKPGSGMTPVYEGDQPPKEAKRKMPPPPTTGVRVRGMHIPDPADEI